MSFTKQLLLLTGLTLVFTAVSPGQRPSATPRQERLLNGMKVLVLNTPGTGTVSLKLRVHAGASFDPQEKEGVMRLLSDALFPTAESRDFFRDELAGSFSITCNYDYVQIDAAAKSDRFLTLVETVAQAMANPEIDKASTAKLKAALLPEVQEMEKNAAYVADRAVTERLFGTFPYGRAVNGTPESIAKIDFADLLFAKERLVTADNATLMITGNVDPALAFRAARRYFGAWAKSDKRVPSTFRQPDAPEVAVVKLDMSGVPYSEVRYAMRGVSRSGKEFAAAEIYARVLEARLAELVAKNGGSDAEVVHEEHILPGAFILSYRSQPSAPVLLGAGQPGSDASPLRSLLSRTVSEAEFAAAKNAVTAGMEKRDPADAWLDVDTYRITSPPDELKAFQTASLADVNALASRVANEPLAAAVVSALPDATTN